MHKQDLIPPHFPANEEIILFTIHYFFNFTISGTINRNSATSIIDRLSMYIILLEYQLTHLIY